jgi:L-seryl-tRNA(Ser) seleniumtransferase
VLAGLASLLRPRPAEANAWKASTYSDNIYTRLLGVKPHLPGHEHTTVVGGCRMPAEVLRAMAEANEYFVDMHELTEAAGRRIAEVTGAEAGLITAGSFSSMILSAAACLTGDDQDRIEALPHPTWPRRECLTQTAHRFSYDRAYRAAGATIVEVETREEVEAAISDKTAMLACLASVERREDRSPDVMLPEEFVALGKKYGVPVIIDAASELPPEGNLQRYVDMGGDLVIISGGKGIRGPQSTGLLAGRADLIEAARLNAAPNGNLGRGMKVGKEEIIGFIVALNRYVELDHGLVKEEWTQRSSELAGHLQGVPGLKAEPVWNTKGYYDVKLSWDESIIPLTMDEAWQKLREGDPPIIIVDDVFMTRCLEEGELLLVARRLREFFTAQARRS